jgi:hypothetical protein
MLPWLAAQRGAELPFLGCVLFVAVVFPRSFVTSAV